MDTPEPTRHDILVPDVPDHVIESYRRLAALNGRSVEEEMATRLAKALGVDRSGPHPLTIVLLPDRPPTD